MILTPLLLNDVWSSVTIGHASSYLLEWGRCLNYRNHRTSLHVLWLVLFSPVHIHFSNVSILNTVLTSRKWPVQRGAGGHAP